MTNIETISACDVAIDYTDSQSEHEDVEVEEYPASWAPANE